MAGSGKRKRVQQWEQISLSASALYKNWRKHKTEKFKYGSSVVYYCAFGAQCQAQIKVKSFNDGTNISFTNNLAHNNHRTDQHGLSQEQKNTVKQLCLANVDRPTDVIEILKVKGVPVPSKTKLQNFLSYFRRKNLVFGNNIGEVVTWCKNNSDLPSDYDIPFVVKYDIRERAKVEPTLRVFISTRRLLTIAPQFDHLHADATYKLNKQGYPLLVVGTTDRKKQFHPLGIAICKNEECKDFSFLFKSLKTGVETICNRNYQPTVLVADCAEAISNGFKNAFGDSFKRVYCFFHVKKSYDKRLLTIPDKQLRTKISADIIHLHHSPSQEAFQTASLLWCEKWSDTGNIHVIGFVNYFMKVWVDKSPNWYIGYVGHQYVPITNNALEACNKYIKQLYTKKNARSIGELTGTAAKMISNWSEMRDSNSPICKSIVCSPEFNINLIRSAYSWKQTNPNIAYHRVNASSFVGCFGAVDGTRVTAQQKSWLLSTTRHLQWRHFADYIKSDVNFYRVYGSYNQHFSSYQCTCVEFFKAYACKHVIVFASLNGSFKFPPEAMTGGLGQKPRRGRPKKLLPGLSKQ